MTRPARTSLTCTTRVSEDTISRIADSRTVEVVSELNNRPRLVVGDRTPTQLVRRWIPPPIREVR